MFLQSAYWATCLKSWLETFLTIVLSEPHDQRTGGPRPAADGGSREQQLTKAEIDSRKTGA